MPWSLGTALTFSAPRKRLRAIRALGRRLGAEWSSCIYKLGGGAGVCYNTGTMRTHIAMSVLAVAASRGHVRDVRRQ